MVIFKKTQQEQENFQNFITKLDNVYDSILQYATIENISSIKKIKENFICKTDDFYREDRKLNIGIIGQVKAGKSSFLNTLLFNGVEVLPKAATPKTATLTKIEYSEENSITVKFYTVEEWKQLEEKSKVDSSLDEYAVSREILAMVKENNIDPYEYLKQGSQKIVFEDKNILMSQLNEYVGQNGKVTPLVKSVRLAINNDALKEVSIVDTPGLNDPVVSRTQKTKEFIEVCDVVFFLSKASNFLEQSDKDLLTKQLPQKGVKKLVLICSRFDEGIMDTIKRADSLSEANVSTKMKLKKHAIKTFNEVVEGFKQRNIDTDTVKAIDECKVPIFISSMTHNMSKKDKADYDEQEQLVYKQLNRHKDLDEKYLKQIGNIKAVQDIFDIVVSEKEDTLSQKAGSFVSSAEKEVTADLNNLKQTVQKRIAMLTGNDKEKLENQKREMAIQINSIKSEIEGVFGELFINLEKEKTEALAQLRTSSREFSALSERTGTEFVTSSYEVSTSKWYNPFSWGTSRTEYYTSEQRYYYLDAADALENIRNYSIEATNAIEDSFVKSLQLDIMKRKLLTVVIQNFNAADDNYDPGYLKLIAEKTLNSMEIPIVKIDVSNFLDSISTKFSGEIRNSSEKSNLKQILASSISMLFDTISNKFADELIGFKKTLENSKAEFLGKLLENINSEFNSVIQQCANKEKEIEKYNILIAEINKQLTNIR
ncbi:dynamin family protein [Clostridium sp. CX1]|uniref:dynamin family protein n=1 Tax=Clostridium sp. CX1 TaxID=2978346 RepID=UPI0021BFD11B|nr:dynamin family protein [Clostridium sp. CX1]MCT8977447.1 dynamin family protein [Clostridium sp. CX1]